MSHTFQLQESLIGRRLVFPRENSAKEKPSTLCLLQPSQLPFLSIKASLFLAMREPVCGLPWLRNPNCNLLLIPNKHLCWRNISHSICFRSTFWWPLQGPEETPDDSRTGEHTDVVPTVGPFCCSLLFQLTLEFKGKCFSWIQTHTPFSWEARQALFRTCSKFSSFWLRLCFVCGSDFNIRLWRWNWPIPLRTGAASSEAG